MDAHEADKQADGGHRSGKVRLLAVVLVSGLASTLLSLLLAFTSALGQTDYLINGGFEQGTLDWSVSYDATFVTVTLPVSSGTWAASLNRSLTTGEIYIYQDVQIFPGATYTLTGWLYKDEADFRSACLRLEWLPSTALPSEECLSDDNGFYRPLTVGPLVAPQDATKARVRAVAKIRTANPPNPIYFDELSLTCSLTPRLHLPLVPKNYAR